LKAISIYSTSIKEMINTLKKNLTLMSVYFVILVSFFIEMPKVSAKDYGYMDETYRPQYHYTAEKGMINDPNGLVYYDGEYHLFHQI
jgi:sucrose-6-phosphate hydrolase SacC (GH32 family)